MATETPGLNAARVALAEIRACPNGLQNFVLDMLDEWSEKAERLLAQELSAQQDRKQFEQDALREQIDRLASLAAELAKAAGDQKRPANRKTNNMASEY
jgi:hypothetical protein